MNVAKGVYLGTSAFNRGRATIELFRSKATAIHKQKKRKEETMSASSSRSFGKVLNRLAERGAGDGRGTRYVSANHATLVSEKPTLAGDAARQRLGCKRVSGNDVIDYATCPEECVTALLCGVIGEYGINQVRSRRGWRTGWTQICKVEGISSVGRRIGDCGSIQRAHRCNRRRFVGCHLGTQQVRNRDRRNDQDDCNHDQQLN